MLGVVEAYIPGNTVSNRELRWSFKALRFDLVLRSTTTLSNICRREYALTMDDIMKQLRSQSTVSFALHWWTSTNTLAIMSVIAYYMDQNWALHEVQLGFDKVDHPLFSSFKSEFRMLGQGPTFWSKASRAFERCAWSFWAYRWPFDQNFDW